MVDARWKSICFEYDTQIVLLFVYPTWNLFSEKVVPFLSRSFELARIADPTKHRLASQNKFIRKKNAEQ